VGNREERIGIR